jgi:hypothetical protein
VAIAALDRSSSEAWPKNWSAAEIQDHLTGTGQVSTIIAG